MRRMLQDLGWDSYSYVADCLHVMMYVFQRLLPEPLTEAERLRFEQMYVKQSHFGQLPLALLVERFGFLKGVLWDIEETPSNRDAIRVFYRLLGYYGEMASIRRTSDRRIKARKAARLDHGYAGERPLNPERDQDNRQEQPLDSAFERCNENSDTNVEADLIERASGVPERFLQIAEAIRSDRQICCACSEPEWDARTVEQTDETAIIGHYCARCAFAASTEVPLSELKRIWLTLSRS